MSYHVRDISKGELGEISKIQEELDEVWDAESQENPIMVLLELSDMLGAIESYLMKHHPTINLNDLVRMSTATKRAFKTGHRK